MNVINISMNVFSVYRRYQPYFRKKRWKHFLGLFLPTDKTHVLDVGGLPGVWVENVDIPLQVTILNLKPFADYSQFPNRLKFVTGNGKALSYKDDEFEIVYSNSVIEHVGNLEEQRKFANEMRRVGRGVYIQTPNRHFPIEPHFIALFVHWLPKWLRDPLMPWFSIRGWFRKGDPRDMKGLMNEVRLLSYKEMKSLFPDCQIYREKVWGMTKSFTAYRKP